MGRPFVDEIGNKYGHLTVIERVPNANNGAARWKCLCDCGKTIQANGYSLREGNYRSCGCKHGPYDKLVKDETGNRYGKLVVIEREYNEKNQAYWKCICDCGNHKIVKGATLREGGVKSCGCLNKFPKGEASFNSIYRQYKHQAKIRSHSWNLSIEQVRHITKQNCHYCGKKPSQGKDRDSRMNGNYIYNGIDRVDSSLGYEIGNVVPCCGQCNKAKNNLSVEQFKELIVNIYRHWIS